MFQLSMFPDSSFPRKSKEKKIINLDTRTELTIAACFGVKYRFLQARMGRSECGLILEEFREEVRVS